jgi:hypothetical protein
VTSSIVIENYIRGRSGNLGVYALNAADTVLRKAGVLPHPPKRSPTFPSSGPSLCATRPRPHNRSRTSKTGANDGDADAVDRVHLPADRFQQSLDLT